MDSHALIVVLVHLALLGVAARLLVVDIQEHRLPDRLVLPTLVGALAAVILEAVLTPEARAERAAAGMLLLGGFYGALRTLSREGMGGGDVKLGAVIGLVLGWHGWDALVVGGAAAFVLGAGHALALVASGRADRSTHIAFGPWMILGAVLGIGVG
ncbi:prepilin peptidase [Microbacterium resistens]|uniref:prepilin peptidase n=1 Tax=Microbacterium resistens TaxID=156977 RepID=UPI00366CB242